MRRRSVPGRDGALVQELVYGTLRRFWTLERRLAPRLRKPPDALPHALLLVGAYQLTEMRTPAHAAVSETVSACDVLGLEHVKGFVNAVLRSLQRETPQKETAGEAEFDHPPWLQARVQEAWPEHWQTILEANNRHAPMSLRVNRRRIGRDEYLLLLKESKNEAFPCELGEDGLTLSTPVPVDRLPGFGDGLVSVQDCAAQLAAPLLGACAGDRVADLCAAPGGKAAHIFEHTPDLSELVAVEKHRERLDALRGTFARLGATAVVRHADAGEIATWWDGRPFERVLLDAPCSGTGVIRRHPDIKHLKREDDLTALAAAQARLLRAGFAVLAPGGRLLYVTCSVLPEENDAVVAAFLRGEPRAGGVAISQPWGLATVTGRQLLPGVHGDVDGFFYALVERTA